MHQIEKKLIESGIIDSSITSLSVDDWFENAIIKFNGEEQYGEVTCEFLNCFTIEMEHDKTYSKGRNVKGNLNYKYFIQDIEINKMDDFYDCKISAWPYKSTICCKNIEIKTEKSTI